MRSLVLAPHLAATPLPVPQPITPVTLAVGTPATDLAVAPSRLIARHSRKALGHARKRLKPSAVRVGAMPDVPHQFRQAAGVSGINRFKGEGNLAHAALAFCDHDHLVPYTYKQTKNCRVAFESPSQPIARLIGSFPSFTERKNGHQRPHAQKPYLNCRKRHSFLTPPSFRF
jgi:hypothetical protein